MFEYNAVLDRVVDGDTVDATIDLGFDTWKKTRIRFYGINAPESRTRDLEEKKKGLAAKERLIEIQKVLENHQVNKNRSSLGKSIEVLVENKLKNQNKYFGRNVFLNSVIFEGEEKYIGKLVDVKITKTNRNSLFGKIDENKKMRAA